MSASPEFLQRLPNDIGGADAGPVNVAEHELAPWEKRCHALADVLDFHKIVNTEEKRRGVEGLGAQTIAEIGYYERWITAFAVLLFEKSILTPEELALKVEEVRARRSAENG
jgi:hypothetical protein